MALTPKTILGTYEIVAPLGAGGMGEVYRARDLRLGREVALKVLPSEMSSDPDRLSRFEREARTVAGLNHPNIVTLFSIDNVEEVHFLTMELVDGQTLDHIMMPGGLQYDKILELMIPLGDALASAHEKGVVHRDLKPGNVMITREGRVKVLDFGLAKLTESGPDSDQTQTAALVSVAGQIVGTVPYMSPEQVRGDKVDARSDIFSIGIILYELAAGKRPFTGETNADLVSSILRDTPPSLTSVRADLPPDLERLVNRCLEKDPRKRIQTALDVSNELRRSRKLMQSGIVERPIPEQQDIASIAVLPFVNRSANAEDEYFSDGLSDELLNVLSKIKGLRVSARTSSFRFRNSTEELAVIGEKLNVSTLVEGSVRKSGNRVRISVQLVKVSDGFHLWSETYDRTFDDIFAVQDDIAQSVVKELRATLLGEMAGSDASRFAKGEVADAVAGRTANPEAQRLYLLGRHHLNRNTPEQTEKGIEYFKQALALDPDFAQAWATLGRAYFVQADFAWVTPSEGARKAREAAERALSLEPNLIAGHLLLGYVQLFFDWDWQAASASLQRAKELAPDDPSVLSGLSNVARALGRLDEAIDLCNRILERDPLSAGTYQQIAYLLHSAARFAEAEQAHKRSLELSPGRAVTYAYIALEMVELDRKEKALEEAAKEPIKAYGLWAEAIIHHKLGDRASSDSALKELIAEHADTMAYQVAEAYAGRGEHDDAFDWLERAYAQRDSGLSFVLASYYFRSLRKDHRWNTFLEKMKLEE
jgi:serine/threonine protein kinase/Flp pilus assembly protein TadD